MKTRTVLCALLALAALDAPVLAQTHDSTPPALTAFTFTPSNPNATAGPATVTFSITATDDLSGVASVRIGLACAATGVQVSGSIAPSPSTSLTTTVPVIFPRYSAAGTWSVVSVILVDAAGNQRTLFAADLTGAGFSTAITVQ